MAVMVAAGCSSHGGILPDLPHELPHLFLVSMAGAGKRVPFMSWSAAC
jgi:hypothetical protein